MPRGFGKKKDPFADLDQDFKESAERMAEAELRDKLAQTALNQEALDDAKTKDTDYLAKKDAFSTAGAVYREGKKGNKLRTKYLRLMLDAKGKDTGDSGVSSVE